MIGAIKIELVLSVGEMRAVIDQMGPEIRTLRSFVRKQGFRLIWCT
jgi:hypothetical protein